MCICFNISIHVCVCIFNINILGVVRFREVGNVVRDRERSEVLHRSKVTRVTEAVSNATTHEEVEGVLYSNDTIDILCDPSETKIRQLERELRNEKLQHQRTRRFVLGVPHVSPS